MENSEDGSTAPKNSSKSVSDKEKFVKKSIHTPPGIVVEDVTEDMMLPGSNIITSPYAGHSQIKQVKFVKIRSRAKDCPKVELPEFAIIERSNVGKSSLINALVRKKEVALTSKETGSLILLRVVASNFFSHTIRDSWAGGVICLMIGRYLLQEHIRASGGFRNSFTQSQGCLQYIGHHCLTGLPSLTIGNLHTNSGNSVHLYCLQLLKLRKWCFSLMCWNMLLLLFLQEQHLYFWLCMWSVIKALVLFV